MVGYWSTRYGATGIEIANNTDLSSIAGEPQTLDDLINRATGGPQPGNNVVLTLDPGLQALAYQELQGSTTGRGSIVAINPKTGEILAMATSPSFDPNDIDENYPELASDPDAPLINRATQSLYPPGSVFKVITAAAALQAGVSPEQTFFDDGSYELPGYTVHNFQGKDFGEVTFTRALAYSINVIFAKIAVRHRGGRRPGADGRELRLRRPLRGFPAARGDEQREQPAARTSGPREPWPRRPSARARCRSNSFQMALVTAAIANDGRMVEPRLVREVRSPDGIILDKPTASIRTRSIPPDTARTLNEMMQQVIIQGGLTEAEIRGRQGGGQDGYRRVGQRGGAFVVDHLRPRRRPGDRHVRDGRERRQGRRGRPTGGGTPDAGPPQGGCLNVVSTHVIMPTPCSNS